MSILEISDEAFSQQLPYLRRARRGKFDNALFELGANGDIGGARAIKRGEKRHRIEFRLLQQIGRVASGLPAFEHRLTKIASHIAQRVVEIAQLRFRKLLDHRLQSAGGAGLAQLQPHGATDQRPKQKHIEDD